MNRRARKLRGSLAIAAGIVLIALSLAVWPAAPESLAPAACAAAEVAPSGTTVTSYSPGCAERYAAEGRKAVLFFRAYWCGACADAAAHIADAAASGPSDLVVIEADFDDSESLRRRYGVTVQHTFVQVGAGGEELGQWLGFGTIAELYAALR